MDRHRYSALSHRTRAFACPVSERAMDRVVDALDLAPGDRVLDLGCGHAELLARVVERHGIGGVGVDLSPFALERGGARTTSLGAGRVDLRQADLNAIAWEGFAAVLCVGAVGDAGWRGFLGRARETRSVRLLVLGELHWTRPPSAALLDALGVDAARYGTLDAMEADARALGFRVRTGVVSDLGDWDAYEGELHANVEAYAAAHPDDPDVVAMLARTRGWFALYEAHARGVLGFSVHVLERAD